MTCLENGYKNLPHMVFTNISPLAYLFPSLALTEPSLSVNAQHPHRPVDSKTSSAFLYFCIYTRLSTSNTFFLRQARCPKSLSLPTQLLRSTSNSNPLQSTGSKRQIGGSRRIILPTCSGASRTEPPLWLCIPLKKKHPSSSCM
jgi:hypothetical protein